MGTKAQDMQNLIEQWMSSKTGRDITLLSRRSGLEYNTVRRIYNGSNPECQTALAILAVVTDKASALNYLKVHFPQAAAFHEMELTKISAYSDAEKLRPAIEQQLSFVLMNLAYGGQATRQSILKNFGEFGLEAAHDLVNSNCLKWADDKLVPFGEEKFFSYENKHDLVSACRHIVELSRSDKGYPVVFIGAITEQESEKVKSLTREFCSAMKEIFLNSKGGEKVVALSNVYLTLFDGEN